MKAWIASRRILLLLVVSTVGCDQVTKRIAEETLAGVPGRSYLADVVRITYAENRGGFLSIGADLPSGVRTLVFSGLTGLALVAFVVAILRRRWSLLATVGVALFVAGGASNWFDRVARGSVVDFLNLGVGPLRTGVFNVADVAIMLGAGLFVLAEFRRAPSHDTS